MIGDGVIAESVISFKITWKSPGKGAQPSWNQNDQFIMFHSTDIYPDLSYTRAQALATYYKYTSIDALVALLKQINAVIDSKLGTGSKTNTTNEAELKRLGPGTPTEEPKVAEPIAIPKDDVGEPAEEKPEDKVTIDEPKQSEPSEPVHPGSYTVTVYGDKLRMIDGQVSSANIRIRHKVSANLFRKVDEEIIDNSKSIWLEVKTSGGTRKMTMEDFKTEDGLNLLVQVLPTVDLTLQPAEKAVVPKSEKEEDYRDKIKYLRALRMNREEDRYTRSKQDLDTSIKGIRPPTR